MCRWFLFGLTGTLFLTFQEALDFLYTRHATGMKLGLDHIRALVKDLKHPERTFKSIHIAGTNGKGSTASILASVFQAAGYKTGLYTSPHLISVRERIQINSVMISESRFTDYLQKYRPLFEKNRASYFEIMTAMAFLYFADEKVDIAILETGLGGRLDATNVITPELCIITDISFDHTKTLGRRLKLIAAEKAGIYKQNIPCVTGVQRPQIIAHLKDLAKQKSVPVFSTREEVHTKNYALNETGCRFQFKWKDTVLHNLHLNLLGIHQVKNASTALLALQVLQQNEWAFSEQDVRQGLQSVNWPARLQLLPGVPRLLIDSAHNNAGIRNLVYNLNSLFSFRKLIFVFGVLRDKDYSAMLHKIASVADVILFTKPDNERALDPTVLSCHDSVSKKTTEVYESINEAINRACAIAGHEDLICAAGSIYFVGEVLSWYQQNKNPRFRTFSE